MRIFVTSFVLASLACLGGAQATTVSPQRSLRALGGQPLWVPFCSRRGINGSAPWFDATSTAIMDQQACLSPSWGTVSAVRLVYAAFDMPQQGEVDRPFSVTGSAAVFVPGANNVTVIGGNGVAAGSTTLNAFPGSGLGANGISVGQLVTSSGGAIAAGAYVTNVVNSFTPGSGNVPVATSVTISAPTTAATANGQPFTFAGAFLPARFGGKRGFTIEPGHDVIVSDPMAVTLAPSSWFLVRTAANSAQAGLQLMDVPVSGRITVNAGGGAYTEYDNRGVTFNDQTMTPTALSNSGGGFWGPVALLAQINTTPGAAPPGAVLILGDSIAAGTGDNPDPNGFEGYIQRSLTNAVPFVTAARGSTTAFALAAHGDGQYSLAMQAGVTDVLLESGRNDIAQFGVSAVTLGSTIAQIATRYSSAGKRVWCFTIPPTTYSSDGWMTTTNQSFPAAAQSTSSAAASGNTTLQMAAVGGIVVGQTANLNLSAAGAISPGTTVSAVNTATGVVTLSKALTGAISNGTRIYFGANAAAGSPIETQRLAYNASLRSGVLPSGCGVLADVDAVFSANSAGKWRTDLGQASVDGVHPSGVLHQAVIDSGLLAPAKFVIE